MTKFDMLKQIAINCIENPEKAKLFAFKCKEHKSMQEVEKLYTDWKAGIKDKIYFEIEIIGYTPAKKQAYLKRHNLI